MWGKSKQQPANPVRFTKDASGAPAVDLDKVEQAGHVNLSKGARTVGVSLRKRGLAGMRGRVVVVLDHSGSMHGDYSSGAVQRLLERTLGFGLQIDTDGSIEVIPFDSKVWKTVTVDVGNYQTAARTIWKPTEMGGTSMVKALKKVRDLAKDTKNIIVCVFITDGDPDRGTDQEVIDLVCDLARYPVFFKFVALRNVPFLNKLNKLEDTNPGARIIDNVNTQTIDPDSVTPEEFAEAMTEEWNEWVPAAVAAGVIHQ